MKISPINSSNQVAHKKVDMKYYRKAYETYRNNAPYHNQGPLIESIENSIYYGLLSKQDAIDTLLAIKPFSKNAISVIETMIEDLKKELNR